MWKYELEYRIDKPETEGETDKYFDLDNYKDWLEAQLIEARKQLALYDVVGRSEQYFCCKDQIEQRCGEQCLSCFQFENKD